MNFKINTIPHYSNYAITSLGRVFSIRKNRWLTSVKNKRGYYQVNLGRREIKLIHRLVLETFVGPCPPGMECCHKNGNRLDNRLDNLYWGTRSDNMQDAKRHGTLFVPDPSKIKKGSSKYKYVYWSNKRNKWIAQYKNRHYIGQYDTEEEAYNAIVNCAFYDINEFNDDF